MTPEKHAAIQGYLADEFNEPVIEEWNDKSRMVWQFMLPQTQASSPMVALSHEFIDDSSAEEISEKLARWGIAAQMRAHPDMRVLVTNNGFSLESRD